MKFLNEDALTILKWVITILITGFIAQFGKKLANYIIDKTRERKSKRALSNNRKYEINGEKTGTTASQNDEHDRKKTSGNNENQEELLKARKKIEKEKQKQIKKMAKAKEKAAKKQNKE
jgi:biopolymer transport protein ExbB/TolQ